MSDYTPTTEQIRAVFMAGAVNEEHFGRRGEAFDHWLAAHDAEVRAGVVSELPDIAALREARAETWDEAVAAVFAWWNTPDSQRPALIVNPYGAGLPVKQEGADQ